MKIEEHIKTIAAKKNFSEDEQDILKNAIVKYAIQYLDLTKGKNSLINITDVVKNDFSVLGTNYPFERDIARRMERTRDYKIYESKNKKGDDEVYVVPVDRKWHEKYNAGWTILMLFVGGAIPLLFNELPKLWQSPADIQSELRIRLRLTNQNDSSKTYQLQITDSSKSK